MARLDKPGTCDANVTKSAEDLNSETDEVQNPKMSRRNGCGVFEKDNMTQQAAQKRNILVKM